MPRINVMEARKAFSKTVNRVAFGKERIILERRGEDVVAVVPVEDLAALEALEARGDLEEARRALAEPGETTYDEVRRRLGLA
jgi:antitoxin Phd